MKNAILWDVTVALVRTDVSEERIAFIIRVKRNIELGTLAVTRNTVNIPSLLISFHPDDGGNMFL
jgi:hypothetical protein